MRAITASVLDQLPLAGIESVIFYKRDELTTDLICCEVDVNGRAWFFHEELEGWDALLKHLEQLPGFRRDWYQSVAQPAFARNEFAAFERRAA
jgi:hypothetical protein